MYKSRSAVFQMLKAQAERDRQIEIFPSPFISEATPYKQYDFSKIVKESCKQSNLLLAGLKISKAIFLGDVGVGKTCLVNKFCHETFDKNYKATIGVDFEVERFDILKVPFNLQIWDTAGQERFKCIASSYYRGANIVVIIFDLSSLNTLSHCPQWLYDAQCTVHQDAHIFLVGTKKDLISNTIYSEIEDYAIKMAKNLKAEFWSVSSKNGDCVNDLFFRMAALAFNASICREKEKNSNAIAYNIGSQVICKYNNKFKGFTYSCY